MSTKTKLRRDKGQSTLEYVIIIAVIIAAVITFASGTFKTKITSSMEHTTDQMANVVNRINY